MDWIYYVALVALLVTGLFLNLLSLPGLWLMLASTAGYGWVTHWRHVGWPSLLALLVLTVVAEVLEFVAGSAGAKKAGGSVRGMMGAVVGGLLGGFFLTFLVPVPILGTIAGVCVGTFLGALLVELLVGKEMGHSMRIGAGAAKGRFIGTMLKTLFGVAILIVAMVTAFPTGAAARTPVKPALPRPATGATPAIGLQGMESLSSFGLRHSFLPGPRRGILPALGTCPP
jgi:uncharacterized protein YqgC (DUF456 family)